MRLDFTHVKNCGDFRAYVLFLANGKAIHYSGSLEEYLRALWSLIQQVQTKLVTYTLLGQLLHDAFSAESSPFDGQWLQYEAPPDLEEEENEMPYFLLQQMICYQIVDLYRMAQVSLLENKLRYYGIDSPTGQRWFNFDVASYLQCAAQSLQEDSVSTDATWIDPAGFCKPYILHIEPHTWLSNP